MSKASWSVYGLSLLLHSTLAAAMSSIERPPKEEAVRIVMRDVEVAPAPPPAPEPPAPEPARAAPKPRPSPARAAPRDTPAQEAPSDAPAEVPELGVEMTGNSGPGGAQVPVGSPRGVRRTRKTAPQALGAPSAPVGCAEPEVKPKVLELPQPGYDESARAAGVSGRVRLRITVGTDGRVRTVTVLESLHPELDRSARLAAEGARFSPATRCGQAVEATFNISIRFDL